MERIAPTTDKTRTVTMTILEVPHKLPILLLKIPAQEEEIKGNSKTRRINDPLTDFQWSVLTMTPKLATNLHAAAKPHVAN